MLILAGGGTALCQKYLKAAFPNALIPPDPVTAQLTGLGRLGQKTQYEKPCCLISLDLRYCLRLLLRNRGTLSLRND